MLNDVFKDTESKMGKAVEATRHDFASIRTGRASPALLDRLEVEAYGAKVPLKQVASVSSPDGRSLVVSAFDKSDGRGESQERSRRAIWGSIPNVDGQNVRLSIPPLTEERRKDLVKVVHKRGEEGKVAIRNIRHKSVDAIKALLKDHKITEDDEQARRPIRCRRSPTSTSRTSTSWSPQKKRRSWRYERRSRSRSGSRSARAARRSQTSRCACCFRRIRQSAWASCASCA